MIRLIHRSIFLLTLLFMLIGVASIPTQAAVPPTYRHVGPGDTYLALGNSLTTGDEAPANNDNQPGYPAIIYAELSPHYPALKFINVGVSGETSTSMLVPNGQLDNAIATIASEYASGRRVGLVTLDIGGNDVISVLLGNSEGQATLEQFEVNLERIVSRLQAVLNDPYATPQCDILLMTYYNPYPNLPIPPAGEKLADMWIPQFNAVIQEVAARHGLPVADVTEPFVGNEAELIFVNQAIYADITLLNPLTNPNFERDLDFHPRVAGHRTIAQEFLTVSGSIPPQDVQFVAPSQVLVQKPVMIVANAEPGYASEPLTYTWQPQPTSKQQASATYTWDTPGPQTITVTLSNAVGVVTHTHTLTVTEPLDSVAITGPTTGTIGTPLTFVAVVTPSLVTMPITYTWSPSPTHQQATSATYIWQQAGEQTVTVTATNTDGSVTAHHTILLAATSTTTPTLVSSNKDGAPGSMFLLEGQNLLPKTPAKVSVNGHSLTDVPLTTERNGMLRFVLQTTGQQPAGLYEVQVTVGDEATLTQASSTQVMSTTIRLDQSAPMRELVPDSDVPQLSLPTNVAPLDEPTTQATTVFLPLVQR